MGEGQLHKDIKITDKKKKKRSFADYIVFVSIFMVTMFTISAFVLQFSGMMEVSATLTTSWFAFWTVEIIALASIKKSKTKYDYKPDNLEEQIEIEEEDNENAG